MSLYIIVHDHFHVSGYLSKGVDLVRRKEHRDYLKMGLDFLKGTKYLWLTNRASWRSEQKKEYGELKELCLKVGRAYSMKEAFRKFWQYRSETHAREFFKKWYNWATHSRLKPMIEAARTLKRHLPNIMTYFKHRITISASVGLNGKVQAVKANAKGFRNFENLRIAILFHCGGLNLYPFKRA